MLKFLRRLFIVLILILVAFVVYRFINPDGASRLIDKIKSIPASVWIGWKDKIKIEWETTSITGDVQKDSYEGTQEDDFGRLESLNKEIEEILWEDKSEVRVDENILKDVHTEDEDLPVVKTDKEPEVSVESTWTDISTWVEGNPWNTASNTEDVKETKPVSTQTKKTNKLSNFDYQQILNVFGNLFK